MSRVIVIFWLLITAPLSTAQLIPFAFWKQQGAAEPSGNGSYFVITQGTWTGALGGISGANDKCLSELQANSWMGKSNSTLTSETVKAFICDSNTCNSLVPDTEYAFAVSGAAGTGGATFTTDASGLGPNDGADWSGATYFGGSYTYFSQRGSISASQWSNNPANTVSFHCDDLTTTSGDCFQGYSGGLNTYRWNYSISSAYCYQNHRLICIVNSPESLRAVGTFYITGATGGADTAEDELLTDGTTVTVNWTASDDADDYTVTLKNSNDSDIGGCSPDNYANITGSSQTFSGCTLTVGNTYKITMIASNGSGSDPAENDGYLFTVVDPTPQAFQITGINGGTDLIYDTYLTDFSTTSYSVQWEASTGAANYTVEIRDSNGTTFDPDCKQTSVAGTTATFTTTNCPLNMMPFDYTLYVTAHGATQDIDATNDGLLISKATAINCPSAGLTVPYGYIYFYDDGGASGNISSDCSLTVSRAANEEITIWYQDIGAVGEIFQTKTNSFADVYQGTSTAGTLLGSDTGTITTPFGYTATQDLHFNFTKGGGDANTGWQSIISTTSAAAAPGSFSIAGVRSTGSGTDTNTDAYLTDGLTAKVLWSTSTGADTYDASIWDENQRYKICSVAGLGGTSYDFTGCTLAAGSTYEIVVVAKNSSATMTSASNDGFAFTVSLDPPGDFQITGVTGGADNTLDEYLGNDIATANWSSATGATDYDAVLTDNAGVPLGGCTSSKNTSNTSVEFSDCTLISGNAYKIRVIANDIANRATAASNNDFSFTVDTTPPSAPTITGVTSTGAGTDTTPDDVLSDGLFAKINWGDVADEDYYVVQLLNYDGSAIANCDAIQTLQNQTSVEFTDGNCILTDQGYYRISLQAKDTFSNTSDATNDLMAFVASAGPGPFEILGITSTGAGSDATIDDMLADGDFAEVHWTDSSNENSYEITLMDDSEVTICGPYTAAQDSTSYELTNVLCTVTAGNTYKVEVVAKDLSSNPTNAVNTPYSFMKGIMAELVKDINYTSSDSDFGSCMNTGTDIYFSASDGTTGNEIWKSDGTEVGTFMIKDINPGTSSSSPVSFTLAGTLVYFRASDGTNGIELWKTDGTEIGTVMIKDINPGVSSSSPGFLAALGTTLYFSASNGTNGAELWKTDGTEVGTVMVKDIYTDSSSSSPTFLTAMGTNVFFRASDGTNGVELWKTDGTEGGTVMVKDIYPGSSSSSPNELTVIGSTLFFAANDGTNGEELWKTDGTEVGTVMVKDVYSGASGGNLSELTARGSTLYFSGTDGSVYGGLWKSDGTGAGTVVVKDIYPGSSSGASSFFAGATYLYFQAKDGINESELWRSDGTQSGTVMVKDIYPGGGLLEGSLPSPMAEIGTYLYFVANDGTNGYELWKSDGTESNTVMVKNINSGAANSSPTNCGVLGTTLYFGATDTVYGEELMKSDGTVDGTVLVKDMNQATLSSLPGSIVRMNNTLLFAANQPEFGIELWISDGTEVGTTLVKDINSNESSSNISPITRLGTNLYFSAYEPTNGKEFWESDGTELGTTLVKDINSGTSNSLPNFITIMGSNLYFKASDSTNGSELWKSDGTQVGTVLVKDIASGITSGPASDFVVMGSKIYFSAYDGGTDGTELWESDGTEAGTKLVKDIRAGSLSSSPDKFTVIGDTLYFAAYDQTAFVELHKSDGTEAGTGMVKDIFVGGHGDPQELTAVGDTLFFRAYTGGVNGAELWKSDGTEVGTVLVKDIRPGADSSSPAKLMAIGGTLYFTANDGTNGVELWKSDGTEIGTVMIADLQEGLTSSSPDDFTSIGASLYFKATHPSLGTELFRTDGTSISLVCEVISGSSSGFPSYMTRLLDNVYFSATNPNYGYEIFRCPLYPADAKQGYFVKTNLFWNGNLGGLSGADAKCLTDLQTYDWMGKSNATLNSTTVKAFLCDSTTCNDLTSDTTYSFAVSNSPNIGGATFTTDSSSLGPYNSESWSDANHFGVSSTPLYSNRATTNVTIWANSPSQSGSAVTCNDFQSSSDLDESRCSSPENTADDRWDSFNYACDMTRKLICIVNPP